MSKSVTVNFEDGTSHTYDDVPDNVSDDQVNERAAGEFGKAIKSLGAEAPAAETSAPATPTAESLAGPVEPGLGTKIAGAAKTVYDVAAEHPYIAGGALFGAAKYNAIKNTLQSGANAVDAYATSRNAQALADIAHQARMAGNPIDPTKLHAAYENVLSRVPGATPSPPPTTPVPQPNAINGGNTFLQRMAQLSESVKPYLTRGAETVSPYLTRGAAGATALLMPGNAFQQTNEDLEMARRRQQAGIK